MCSIQIVKTDKSRNKKNNKKTSILRKKVQANFRLPQDVLELLGEAATATGGNHSQADILEMCVNLHLDPSIKCLGEEAVRLREMALASLKAKHGTAYEALLARARELLSKVSSGQKSGHVFLSNLGRDVSKSE